MDNIIKSIEALSGTKIYLKYLDKFEYGVLAEEKATEISEGIFLSVLPNEKFDDVSNVIYTYTRQHQKLDNYRQEVEMKSQSMYSFVEIAKLSALNIDRKELLTIFLKLVKNILSFDSAYVLSHEDGEYIKQEEGKSISEETLTDFIFENQNSQDIFYSVFSAEMTFLVGYNLEGVGTLVLVYKENFFKFEEIEILIKILAEEIKVVIDIGAYKTNIEKLYFKILKRIAEIVNKRNYVFGSNFKIDTYMKICELIGLEYGLTPEDIVRMNIAITLKDIGTIIIPENILHKVGPLTQSEYNIIKKHPVFSANILEKTEYFEEFSNVIKHHHEKWNGTGYPDKLNEKEIPASSRIIHIVDVFLALIDGRVYRKKKFEYDEAVAILKENAGLHFDPEVINIFMEKIEPIKEILKEINA